MANVLETAKTLISTPSRKLAEASKAQLKAKTKQAEVEVGTKKAKVEAVVIQSETEAGPSVPLETEPVVVEGKAKQS
jgi:hypothetical protein